MVKYNTGRILSWGDSDYAVTFTHTYPDDYIGAMTPPNVHKAGFATKELALNWMWA